MGKRRHKKKRNKWGRNVHWYTPAEKDFGLENIRFSLKPFLKMNYYCKFAPGEVSGLGKAIIKGNTLIVKDTKIFKQECSSGGTHLDAEMLARFTVDLIRQGCQPSEYNIWWHTHNNFGCFWSGTDTSTIEELSKNTRLISINLNKMGDVIARIDEKGFYSTINVINPLVDEKLSRECKIEVDEKVSETVYPVVSTYRSIKDNTVGKFRYDWRQSKWVKKSDDIDLGHYNPDTDTWADDEPETKGRLIITEETGWGFWYWDNDNNVTRWINKEKAEDILGKERIDVYRKRHKVKLIEANRPG